VLNQAPNHEEGRILNLGTTRRWVVSFTSALSPTKELPISLDKRLSGP